MSGFARLALGSLGRRPDPGPVCWALAACLERQGRQVRHFFSRACYCSPQGGLTATGSASGYLDSWLLSTDACRTRLAEAYASADFVLAEGCFPADRCDLRVGEALTGSRRGGDLATLAERLDLPRVIVLDAAQAVDCRIPPRPDAVDGVILDGVADAGQFARIQTCIEGVWGVPVLAALERDEGLRQRLVSLIPGAPVPSEVINTLAARMSDYIQWNTLWTIADRPTLPQPTAPVVERFDVLKPPTIATAYDAAFSGYFADALEQYEKLGARIVDFSPLNDESLPDDVDVVLIGCGRPEAHAEQLAANHCMLSALRDFARRGGYIYSEGGGTAYLSRTLTLEDGRDYPLVDALPLAATLRDEPEHPCPVEFTARRDCLFAPAGTTLRAYRGGRYQFVPQEPSVAIDQELAEDWYRHGNTVGGRLQLHFAAQPVLLRGLFARPSTGRAGYVNVG